MTWWSALALVVGGGISYGLHRWTKKDQLSADWFKDHARRSTTGGIDQVGVQSWPIKKTINEHGRFNAERLRKRA